MYIFCHVGNLAQLVVVKYLINFNTGSIQSNMLQVMKVIIQNLHYAVNQCMCQELFYKLLILNVFYMFFCSLVVNNCYFLKALAKTLLTSERNTNNQFNNE